MTRKVAAARGLLLTFIALACVARTIAADKWPDVFNPLQVLNLHLQMDAGDWSAVQNDASFMDERPAQFWADGETPIAVTVKRKSDPPIGPKVSIKIDINEVVPGQTWRGVKKLSLENGNGGNGVVRECFAWQIHRRASESGLYDYPSAYAAWVRLYVNGEQIGIYTHAEERDKQMLQNRGMWKEGATWLYKYDPTPTLEAGVTNGSSPTIQHLCYLPFANTCTQSNLEADLPQWVDMQAMLTFAAIEGFIGNLDGLFTHNAKNCFAVDFAPPLELRRIYLPWDLDTGLTSQSFNIYTGGPMGGNSIYQQTILGHYWFRTWYRNTMTDLLDGPMSVASLTALLNQIEPVLAPLLDADPNSGLGESAAGHFAALRQYLTNRINNVRGQVGAIVGGPRFSPTAGEIVPGTQVTLTHTNASGTIYYTLDGTDPRALGGAPAGTAYSNAITLTDSTHITARVRSGTNWSSLRQATFNIANHAAAIKVTEIMYAPRYASVTNDNDEYEFIEVQNRSATPVNLSGCYFDGLTYQFRPGTILGPSNYFLLVRNAVAFTNRYPSVAYHGIYWGALDSNGEKIRLKNSDANNVFSVEYNNEPPWPLGANQFGWSLVNQNPDADPDNAENWRASANLNGSPGAADPSPAYRVGMVINEVLTHTDPPQEDAIELHNPTTNAINVSGWYLSDRINFDDPTGAALKRYRIPAGTVVSPGGFVVFYEGAFNSNTNGTNKFALSSLGEQVYLSSASNGVLSGCIVGAEFDAVDNGISFGRYRTSDGIDFTTLDALTFGTSNAPTLAEFRMGMGATNAGPRIGPVVINEIMYHPTGAGTEFIELYNLSATNVNLADWSIDGAAFAFPAGTVVAASNYLVLIGTTNISPADFRASNNVPIDVPVLAGDFDLGNDGESLTLQKPNPDSTNAPIAADHVRFNDRAPWPTEADGAGPSLERIAPNVYANEPRNWRTLRVGGSPGRANTSSNVIAVTRCSTWKFNELARNLGTAWRATNYSDSGWTEGAAPLGRTYPATTVFSNAVPGRITTYFRKEFVIHDSPAQITNLLLRANYDDGFVAYLNGVEVARRSVPGGVILFSNLASAHAAGTYESVDLNHARPSLRSGANVLAVELHQSGTNDTNVLWDAELTYGMASASIVVTPFRITFFEPVTGAVTIEWESVSGATYRVQHSETLTTWDDLSSDIVATNATTRVTVPTSGMIKFFRVRLSP
jgi:hypothetical protein